MSLYKAQRYSEKGTLADGGIYTPKVNCDIKIACITGTLTVQEIINTEYRNNPVTIATGTYMILKDVLQGQAVKVTGGTAEYHAYA
jgi:hypothetical protein